MAQDDGWSARRRLRHLLRVPRHLARHRRVPRADGRTTEDDVRVHHGRPAAGRRADRRLDAHVLPVGHHDPRHDGRDVSVRRADVAVADRRHSGRAGLHRAGGGADGLQTEADQHQ